MHRYITLALCALGSAIAAGCGVAPLDEDKDAPVLRPPGARALAPAANPTATMPRIVGKPAPLLARPIAIPVAKLPSPNGYDLLAQAAEGINLEGASSPLTLDRLSPEEDLKRQRASTQRNAAPLALVRQALKLPIVVPPKRGLRAPSPPYSKLRMLARVVLQESAVFAADGKLDRAVSGALDVVEMGAALQNGSNRIGMLVGLAIEAMGRGDIARRHSELSATQALAAARRLQSIEARRPGYAALQQEVMWNNLSEMRALTSDPGWRKTLDGAPGTFALFKGERERASLRKISDRQIESNFVAASRAIIAQSRLPYSPQLPAVPDPADAMSTLFVGADTSLGVTRSRVNYERNSAAHRMLMVELALQSFVKSHNKYPQQLSELAPKYLKAVPRDPFAPTSPLRYKQSLGNFLLYSVGPDGKDDGGAPMKERGVMPDSVGDMISGVSK